MNWVLLVLFINGTSQHSPMLQAVNFDTEQACKEAATWVQEQWMRKGPSSYTAISVTCKKKS